MTVDMRLRRVCAGQPTPAIAAAADALRAHGPVPAGGPTGRAGAAAAPVSGPCRGQCCRVDGTSVLAYAAALATKHVEGQR